MTLRKILFWVHLTAGSIAGVVILIMSLTGVSLAYERQVISWVDRAYRSDPPQLGAARLPVGTVLAKVCATQPSTPSSVTLHSNPASPVEVAFGRERTVYFNSYTGDAIGTGSQKTRNFFQTAESWHRWLGASGANRHVRPLGYRNLQSGLSRSCQHGSVFVVAQELVAAEDQSGDYMALGQANGARARLELAHGDGILVCCSALGDCFMRRRYVISVG